MNARWKRGLGNLFLLVLFALVLGRTIARARPQFNWDMLAYMALALEWELDDPVEIHERTYAAARAELPPLAFQSLLLPGVMLERSRDAQAFHEHIAFFRARVLYTGLVSALHRTGVPLAKATHVVSLGAWTLLALLALVWTSRHLPFWAAVFVSLGLAHAPPLLNTASYSTPDALATCVTAAAIYAVLERRSWVAGAVLCLLALSARTETIVFLVLWTAATVALDRENRPPWKALAPFLAASLALYLGLASFSGEYGWWPIFQVSFVEKTLHPSELQKTVDLGVYLRVLAQQLAEIPGNGYFETERSVVGSTLFFVYAGLAIAGIAIAERFERSGDRRALRGHVALLVALLGTSLVRFAIFPKLWDRYLAVFYAVVPLVLLSLAANAKRGERP